MMQVVHSRFNALLSASVLSLVATVAWSQSLTWLGVLPGYNYSLAIDVSADGSVVVGKSYNDAAGYQGLAFRWTRDGGMQNLGTLPGYNYSWATGVSADGRIVVGRTWKRESPNYSRGYRWTAENGMEDLGTLPGGSWSDAFDITPDGSYISVSAIDPSTGDWYLCRWTAGGGLERLVAERIFWWPGRFSADGTVIAGQVNWRGYALRAYR
jgi:probable HAF family extracellular repeat protein